MNYKKVSILDLVNLLEDENLSEKYVKYITGNQNELNYRHLEIKTLDSLLNKLDINKDNSNGFIFGYSISQLNKEFDILKIGENSSLNIELKSGNVDIKKIEKQLIQNRHYLRILGKKNEYYFTYIMESQKLYKLTDENIIETDFSELQKIIDNIVDIDIDLDLIFAPKNFLVSPLNDHEKFISNNYLLTEHQEDFKSQMLSFVEENKYGFMSVTGSAGTGKTLYIYDLAKTLGEDKKVLIVHTGYLCDGHKELGSKLNNINIISIKNLNDLNLINIDIIIIDEAQRLYPEQFKYIYKYSKSNNIICIFSYDINQKLSHKEKRYLTTSKIENLCIGNKYQLTNKIRTNKEISNFIMCLFNLSNYDSKQSFKNIKIIYEPNKTRAVTIAKGLSEYQYISYTSSNYSNSLNYQETQYNSHRVIGQEFENVCVIIDDNFNYKDNKLISKKHPNPDYIFTRLLYQALTRVRNKLTVIITEKKVLDKVLEIVN